jgi:hypothetical protein
MKTSIGLGVFATFGNPNDFQQAFFGDVGFSQTLDLNPIAIELNPDSEIFAVKKDMNSGVYSICFCIYTYAREIQSSRSGTFIGSCVVFENCTSKGIYIYECLRELHNDIIGNPKHLSDNVLQVTQASDFEVTKPHRYETIKANKFTFSNKTKFIDHREFVLIAAPNLPQSELAGTVSDFFSAAIKEFSQIGTLYFTTSSKVIEYVRSQGLIKVISLEQFMGYKPPQKLSAKQTIETKPSKPQPVHQEPQQNKSVRTWTLDWPVSDLPRMVEEHNYVVARYRELENKNKEFVSKENPGTYKSLWDNRDFRSTSASRSGKINLSKTQIRMLAGVVLLVFVTLIIWIVYSLLNTTPERPQLSRSATQPSPRDSGSQNTLRELSPPPNGELSGEDLRYFNNQLRFLISQLVRKVSASEVADLAIKLNPRDIGKAYGTQKEAFTQRLVDINRKCFDGDNRDSRLICIELQHVPIYRGFQ